jgi:hypothetical protein
LRVLIIALGHVGGWLKKRASRRHHVQWLDLKPKKIKEPIHVLHICFPYTAAFVKHVVDYIQKYSPTLVLIESTVPPGTTVNVWREYASRTYIPPPLPFHLCHSPIRGTSWNWWKFVKMIGPIDKDSGEAAEKYYHSLRLKTEVLRSPLETELGKLVDTSIYTLNVAFTQEIDRMCKKLGVDFKEAYEEFSKTFTIDPEYKLQRPVYWPGVIGKKCCIPNTRLLNKAYPSKFLQAILDSNKKRRQELAANPSDMP